MASKPPRKPRNIERRTREYLTPTEVESMIKATRKTGRNAHRNATAILLTYRHALRVCELIALRWDQIDFKEGHLHVYRRKGGVSNVHPLWGEELRALRRLKRESIKSPYVFITERKTPFSGALVRKIVSTAGTLAEIPFPIHPHMLRHATGFKLANEGRDTRSIQHFMGHKNIQHTVRYTELVPTRFNDFWND